MYNIYTSLKKDDEISYTDFKDEVYLDVRACYDIGYFTLYSYVFSNNVIYGDVIKKYVNKVEIINISQAICTLTQLMGITMVRSEFNLQEPHVILSNL